MRHQYRALPPKATWLAAAFVAAALPLAFAQYPGHIDTQKQTGPSLRAIGVLEWTGTAGKPSASRLIPIAVFDGENYQPGGLYLARPQPLALDAGTEYVLQSDGVPQGLFDVNGSQDVQGYWLGYGVWRRIAPPPIRKVRQGKNLPQVVKDADQGRPHFSNSSAGSGSSSPAAKPEAAKSGTSTQTPPADSDRPVLVRRTSSTDSGGDGSSGNGSSGNGASQSGQPSGAASGSAASSAPPVDPDRPVLRRRSETSTANNSPSYLPGGQETAIMAPDPNRPHLTYGSSNPEDTETFEEPKLGGDPSGLQRMVAVSDATDREPHPFAYSWADPEDAAKMKTQMEALAQKALSPAAKPPEKPQAPGSRRRTVAARRSRKAAAALPALSNERFAAYQLTYDSGATVVFSARSVTAPGKTRYVTLVAQPDFYGVPRVIFTSVTEDGMLDLTPSMQLVDAVDAQGNSRGDLIFELRGSHNRHFAIFRVIQGQFQQVFVTGPLTLSPGQASPSGS